MFERTDFDYLYYESWYLYQTVYKLTLIDEN